MLDREERLEHRSRRPGTGDGDGVEMLLGNHWRAEVSLCSCHGAKQRRAARETEDIENGLVDTVGEGEAGTN